MPCIKCGECCRRLSSADRIKTSLKSRRLSRVCRFLDKNNLCMIYANRPKHCKEWICGACLKK